MLESGGIDVFFIEWAKPVRPDAIAASFAGVAKDAEPSLQVLCAIAITRGIPVVSCDLTAEETVSRLDALNDGYGPYNQASAFQPWGKSMRDKHAAATICDYMSKSPKQDCRGLLMFGSDHFVAEDGRNALPLNTLISKGGFDCFIVDNESSDVSF
jgi:hypothetical protein